MQDYKGSATDKPDTLAEAFDYFHFPVEYHAPFLDLVGTSAEAPAEVVASLPFGSYREAVANHLVLGDGRSATLFEQGRFYKFFKYLVRLFCVPPSSSPSSSTPVPHPLSSSSSSQQPIVVTMADVDDKLYFKDYLDQTLTGRFELLHDNEISQLRQKYFDHT